MKTAATAEEETELRVLREQAAASGRELNETVAALIERVSESVTPRRLARQAARRAALPAARVGWPKLAVTTGILVIVAVAVTWQHRRHG